MRPLFSTAHQGGYGQLCAFVTVVIGGIDFAGGGDNGAGVDVTGVQDGMGDVRVVDGVDVVDAMGILSIEALPLLTILMVEPFSVRKTP
jgi:hypothetical protein